MINRIMGLIIGTDGDITQKGNRERINRTVEFIGLSVYYFCCGGQWTDLGLSQTETYDGIDGIGGGDRT